MKKAMDEYHIDEGKCAIYYNNIKQIGFATKTRSFFFKMYAGLLYGNSKLCIFGYADSKKCERCGYSDQDIQHLLLDCPKVEDFRQAVYTKLGKNFTKAEEMLGSDDLSYSFILLHMNRYIYQRKYLELALTPYEFYAILRMEKRVEEEIAIRTKTLNKHNHKWLSILSTGILD